MAKLSRKVASTSQTINIFIQDSTSTTGQGLTGLAFNTASLVAFYMLPRAVPVSITLATQTVTGAYSSGGFVEISSANAPGWYRFDPPDAALASGAFVDFMFKGAANMAQLPVEMELTGWDNQDAVHGGMSALPNTAVTTNGSLITSGSGTAQLTVTGGLASANSTQINSSATGAANLALAFNDTAGSVPWTGIVDQGTAQAATSTTIQLRSAAAFADSELIGAVVTVTGGSTGVGESRTITAYVGATDTATVDAWTVTPTGTITYKLFAAPPGPVTPLSVTIATGGITDASFAADTGKKTIRSNTLQAGAAGTATLDAAASAVTDFYVNDLLYLTGGTGAGQARFITAYNSTTKVATVSANWKTNPDNTTTFAVIPFDAIVGATAPTAAQNATAVWQDLLSGSDFSTVGSVGKLLKDDVDAAISTRMATYAQPTGFLAATFPSGTVANTTNITAGTITTVTNLTNAPTVGDFTATMKASITTATPTALQNADALLNRDMSAVSVTNTRSPIMALRFLRNKWSISGTTLTVTTEDDSTTAWTSVVTPAPGASPISGNDPT